VEHLVLERLPSLHEPIAIVAMGGWNDAASAATNAARFVVRRLGARRFGSIEAEPFYDFRETRPMVRIGMTGEREVEWPTHDFYYARNPNGPHDVVIAVGTEPNLRWRTFSDAHTKLFTDLGVTMTITLGALLADVPHTRPVRVTGTANDPRTAERLNLTTSRYEGPTGIIGVLHDHLRRSGMPAASLWANLPHYVSTNQSPLGTLALLERLQTMTELRFDLSELTDAGTRYIEEVDTALMANPEITSYVKRLEAAIDAGEEEEEEGDESPLPAGEDLVVDIEEFLRGQRDED
jgi:proteasome assembly chaperone (PAC2) family protein